MSAAKQKIAILGGGVGAVTTALSLSAAKDWQDRYDITIYQKGWRLGGKGASGRNLEHEARIEEHGFHVWHGFYENAFRLIQQVYAELGRPADAPLATWKQAFKPHSKVTWADERSEGWAFETIDLPATEGLPGRGGELPTPWEFIPHVLTWSMRYLHSHSDTIRSWEPEEMEASAEGSCGEGPVPDGPGLPHGLFDRVIGLLQEALDLIARVTDPSEHDDIFRRTLVKLVAGAVDGVAELVGAVVDKHAKATEIYSLFDIGCAVVVGLIRDDVIYKGFDVIDDVELRSWLKKHGASETSVSHGLVHATYDYLFAYEKGEASRPNIGAGTGLRMILRLLITSRTAVFWKMQAGMGDTIFGPAYEVLKRRGVKIEFFHEVEGLRLDAEGKGVVAVDVARQVDVVDDDYTPLVDIKGLPCWPSAPLWDQIVGGDRMKERGVNLESAWSDHVPVEKRRLEKGKDFDLVVLGISVAALEQVAADLIEANPRFKQMVRGIETNQTLAAQFWLKDNECELGWIEGATVMTGYKSPLSTWADMSYLDAREAWPEGSVNNISYFCGPMPDATYIPEPGTDPSFPGKEYERGRNLGEHCLERSMPAIWPKAFKDGQMRPDLFSVDPEDGQFWRNNIDPSERYVLATAGSLDARLRADESGFDSLILSGDWLRTGLNWGCVEAATVGGLQAARAISGEDMKIYGETDFQHWKHFED